MVVPLSLDRLLMVKLLKHQNRRKSMANIIGYTQTEEDTKLSKCVKEDSKDGKDGKEGKDDISPLMQHFSVYADFFEI